MLDYCLHAGSEDVVNYAKTNLYVVKTLTEFQYIDEDGKDQGANGMLTVIHLTIFYKLYLS